MRRSTLAAAAALLLAGLLAGPSSGEEQKASQTTAVTVIGSRQAEGILGRQVRSRANENIGRIVDVIVDHTGRTRAAVIDFGGFLGIGNRKIAVDWDALSFIPDIEGRDVVTLELTRDQIKSAPLYRDRRAVIVIGSAGSLPPTP
jgi:hypothetical protein